MTNFIENEAQKLFKLLKLYTCGFTDANGIWHDSWKEKSYIRESLEIVFEKGKDYVK